ncbi:uncharacterized protein LOC124955727 isoform X3 [Vespa velutina]|uniref:uncharacterized protein LOC124955727 isoform X3 n=1 Tax=Vespa velutina TaxID=202808 RepID=UPI001FB3509A|nr:uncharacterized protein LOC124955727 isoform X3 [Vespa velutina]
MCRCIYIRIYVCVLRLCLVPVWQLVRKTRTNECKGSNGVLGFTKQDARHYGLSAASPTLAWSSLLRQLIFNASCGKWILQVLHWSIHTTLGYILMMAIMTYNVYISIALAIGGSLGYWIFGPALIELNMSQFRKRQKIIKCDKECLDAILNQERRESAVSVIAEQLVLEATAEIHTPRDV